MTYQNTSEQFAARIPARGQVNATTPFLTARAAVSALGGIFAGIFDSLCKLGEASARMKKVEALQSKSDNELAAMGLKRENIVMHVFGDLYYL